MEDIYCIDALDHASFTRFRCRLRASYLMFIKYWASATDSLFPVMLMVRSRLAGASRSSQFEIRIIAPESCLKMEDSVKSTTHTFPPYERVYFLLSMKDIPFVNTKQGVKKLFEGFAGL